MHDTTMEPKFILTQQNCSHRELLKNIKCACSEPSFFYLDDKIRPKIPIRIFGFTSRGIPKSSKHFCSIKFPYSRNFQKFLLNGSEFGNATVFEISEHFSQNIAVPFDSIPEFFGHFGQMAHAQGFLFIFLGGKGFLMALSLVRCFIKPGYLHSKFSWLKVWPC